MNHKYLFLLIFLSAITGCSIWPGYQRPQTDLPAAWSSAPAQSLQVGERWWMLYGDNALDALVTEAFEHNRDLALAVARVDEARALSRVANAQFYPSIDATAQRDRSRSSEVAPVPIPASALERNSYRAQLNVSYELDLWGRLRGASDAARAELLATEAARETVRVALGADVVRSYFTLLALDAQIEATQRTLALREDNLKLQRVRNTAGLIGDFPLRQLEAELSAAQAQLPALERDRVSEALALAVLLGRSPRAITESTVKRAADLNEAPPPVAPEGLPSDLLLRRPDIVQAEQRLIAMNARIAAARAALFPRIALTGYLGSESGALRDLFSGPALIWQLAVGLTQPIFQAGRLSGEIDATKAREQQALAQYQKAVQEAFREVQQALSAQTRTREIFEAESARAVALRDTLRLARIRYDNGLVSQLEVIDAERNLLAADLNRADALRARRVAVADLVRALGGGWAGK
ncbi:MAG TPA: efflux transporter outer membrane subunit [Burkholderiales bacterium]|nr:efflux transporter outer membrane subunit [Burkholderiales bacterium]